MHSALQTGSSPRVRFATEADYEECRYLHRKHGTTYYFASRRLPAKQRDQVDALYGFVRVPDEWVDNPGPMTKAESAQKLRDFRRELLESVHGVRPSEPCLRAFADVRSELGMPLDEPLIFLDAMEMDLTRTRYETYDDLVGYMRGSAAAVGLMMCHVMDVPMTALTTRAAMNLGNAMQLTNFLRDIGEDLERGRIYMPLDELAQFGVGEQGLFERKVTPEFTKFMEFQIARARCLFAQADAGIPAIPGPSRLGVQLGRELYSRILDKIEENGFDVFNKRARTTRLEKAAAAVRAAAKGVFRLR